MENSSVASPARRNIVNPRKKSTDVTLPGTGGEMVVVSEAICKEVISFERVTQIYEKCK